MLYSEVLVTFSDLHGLLSFLTSSQWTKETVIVSFQEDYNIVCTCMTSDSSYNSTDSSLIMVDYQHCFLACTFFVCNKTADQAYTHMCMHIIT